MRGPEVARLVALNLAVCLAGAGCAAQRTATRAAIPAALLREARPIGRGPMFHPVLRGAITGRCRTRLGRRYGVHVEVFAANRVVIVAAGIGTRAPRQFVEGRISAAGCFGNLVTLEPTGLVLVRPGSRLALAELFRAWGQPLSAHRLAGFTGTVRVFVNGKPRPGSSGSVPLTRHAEIVLEVGPLVPPHHSYTFPRGA